MAACGFVCAGEAGKCKVREKGGAGQFLYTCLSAGCVLSMITWPPVPSPDAAASTPVSVYLDVWSRACPHCLVFLGLSSSQEAVKSVLPAPPADVKSKNVALTRLTSSVCLRYRGSNV